MKDKIIVVGGGGHAKVIISILKKLNKYEIVGFTDIDEKKSILDVPYLGKDEVLLYYYKKESVRKAVLGLGHIKSSRKRRKLAKYISDIGYEFPAIVSPNSIINEEVEIGAGTIIMDGVIINSGTKIGDFSIINTNSSIDHDCIIGSFTHIAPGVTLSGDVEIGDNVLIGTGANIIHSIKILSDCIIAAGSSVQKSLKQKGIYRGIPAIFVKGI